MSIKIQKLYAKLISVCLGICFTLVMFSPLGFAASESDYAGKTITAIEISGLNKVSKDEVNALIKTKPGDVFSADTLQSDLRAVYETGKFFDVNVNFTEVPEGLKVNVTVVENPILQQIVLKNNTKLTTEKIIELLNLPIGQTLDTKTLNASIRKVEEEYRTQGFIFAKTTDVNMTPEGILTLTFNEGILEGYTVKGNEKTKEYVILREMKGKVGEPFNAKEAKRSMQRVYNLGYFEDVNMKLNPGREPNAIVIETTVVEKKTGSFTLGGAYSKDDGLMGIIELGDTNFRGIGDKVNIHWEFGGNSDSKNYEFSYTRPWLDKKETSISFSYYDMTNEYSDYDRDGNLESNYDKNRKGFNITLGRPQSEYSTNFVTLKNREDTFICYNEGPLNYTNDPQYLKDNFGVTRSITLAHVTDTRDNVFSATEGARAAISAEFAGGILQGDFDYKKFNFEDRHYFKVGHAQVIATRASLGYATGDMPENALFRAGGIDTLRGFRDDQFEGKRLLLGTVEYRYPIVSKVSGAVFTDFGNAWADKYDLGDLKVSYGVGVMMDTPLGSIRLDYGRSSQGGRTHFSFGGQF